MPYCQFNFSFHRIIHSIPNGINWQKLPDAHVREKRIRFCDDRVNQETEIVKMHLAIVNLSFFDP